MTTTTRRERQRQANRDGILKAALNIAERDGWPAVTIRKIADEIEYTSPIIYQHFDNKEAALQAVMEGGYGALEAAMRRAMTSTDPEVRLELSRAYLHFARDHRHVYELMHGLGGVSLDPRARGAAAASVVALTLDAIRAWANARNARLADPLAAGETAWGVLHGMASLGLIPDIGFERVEQLAMNALEALLRSWEAAV